MSEAPHNSVTDPPDAVRPGDERAGPTLFALHYTALRKRAARILRRRNSQSTLQATALVHEAYVRLAGKPRRHWQDRTHFLNGAVRAMRHAMLDRVRASRQLKRAAPAERTPLDDVIDVYEDRAGDLEKLDIALDSFAKSDPEMAAAIRRRFLYGESMQDTARSLGLPLRTFERRWQFAKAWLYRQVHDA
jgi:RNA polymerase sigma-70 factor, ECF subfamily